jgi:ferric-dicitrate binding protein FerR (iron transport regulator)
MSWEWDGTGEPDELERKLMGLEALRYSRPPPRLPRRRPSRPVGWTLVALAAAAMAFAVLQSRSRVDPGVAVSIDGRTARLRPGEWMEPASDAAIHLEGLGVVTVAAGSRVGLADVPGTRRLSLEHGALDARVTAPPRLFVVDTPSTAAVDLGCAYHLEVDDSGRTTWLTVTLGAVSLEGHQLTSVVLAGATATSRSGFGPGIPRWVDAPPDLVDALDAFDRGGHDIPSILSHARPKDALSLWHLVQRVDASERRPIATLLDPGAVNALVRLDPQTLQRRFDQILQEAP